MRHSGRPVLSVALALVFGYSLTIAPMLRSRSRTGRGDPNRPSGLMDLLAGPLVSGRWR